MVCLNQKEPVISEKAASSLFRTILILTSFLQEYRLFLGAPLKISRVHAEIIK